MALLLWAGCTQAAASPLSRKSYSGRLRSQVAGPTWDSDAWVERSILGQIKQWLNIADPIPHSSVLQKTSPDKVVGARQLLHAAVLHAARRIRVGQLRRNAVLHPSHPCCRRAVLGTAAEWQHLYPHTPRAEELLSVDWAASGQRPPPHP